MSVLNILFQKNFQIYKKNIVQGKKEGFVNNYYSDQIAVIAVE